MDLPFDKYTYRARLLPALITFTPLALALAVWFPGHSSEWKVLGAIFVSCGLTALLSQVGRDLGKKKEDFLFQSWGGVPTTRMLSHRLTRLDAITLNRYHAKLRTLLPNLRLPDRTEEMNSPAAANQAYNSAILFLRENTRDSSRFPLVFAENVNYGFRRNLWAWKPLGTISAAAGTLSCIEFFIARRNGQQPALLFGIFGALISLTLLLMWMFVFTPNWVRLAADAYAERLLGSLDSM